MIVKATAPDWPAALDEIGGVLAGVEPSAFDRAVAWLAEAERVYVGGVGRSGLVVGCWPCA